MALETEQKKTEQEEAMHKRNEENLAKKCESLNNRIRAYQIGIAAAKAVIACLSFFSKGLAAFLKAQVAFLENLMKNAERDLEQSQK